MPYIHSEINSDRPFQQLGMDQARVLHTGIPRIDAFLGGFKPSNITLIDSNHPFSFEMLSMLCVNAVKTFEENVVYVDGGDFDRSLHYCILIKKIRIKSGYGLIKDKSR